MSLQIDNLKLTRVEYLSLPVPGELIGLTDEQTKQVTWLTEPWAIDGQVVISANAWFVEAGDKRIVLDPVQAVDVVIRADEAAEQQHQDALKDTFTQAGFSPETIDMVLMSHIEGVGMVAKRVAGEWQPFFPNAKVLISAAQLEEFENNISSATEAADDPVVACWQALIAQGVVTTYDDGEEIVPGLKAEVTHEHCVGHAVFHLGDETTFIGHLAVSPAHLATGPCEALNENAEGSYMALHRVASEGQNLIGPLWAAPGIGCWQNQQLTPISA